MTPAPDDDDDDDEFVNNTICLINWITSYIHLSCV